MVLVGVGARILFYPTSFLFRRRNSIDASAIPSRLLLPSTTNTKSSSFPPPSTRSVDFELISFKSDSYTSIKDILPQSISAVNSPTANSSAAHGINHLVIPTRDYLFAPSFTDISQAVDFIHKNAPCGRTTYVHCKAGRGRSTRNRRGYEE